MTRPRYAVIPTRDRPDQFAECLRAIWDQVDHVLVISHHADYVGHVHAESLSVIPYDPDLPNISAMWNLGLLEAEMGAYGEPHDVAVLNDDAVVPPDWFDRITARMQQHDAAGASGPRGNDDTSAEIAGYAFIVAGERGIRADERLRWWYSDDAIQRRCETAGGFQIVPGVHVEHLYPNQSTVGELARISAEDRAVYEETYLAP